MRVSYRGISMEGMAAAPGWYADPSGVGQRYWDGRTWTTHTAPTVAADAEEGKTIQVVGYVMAGASVIMPILGLAGLILGIITATKRGRGGHGAAIICLSIALSVISFLVWLSIMAHSASTTTTSY